MKLPRDHTPELTLCHRIAPSTTTFLLLLNIFLECLLFKKITFRTLVLREMPEGKKISLAPAFLTCLLRPPVHRWHGHVVRHYMTMTCITSHTAKCRGKDFKLRCRHLNQFSCMECEIGRDIESDRFHNSVSL